MNDDDVYVEFVLSKGEFVGSCLRCKEPSTGHFDSDDEKKFILLICVNCGYKHDIEFNGQLQGTLIYEG